jgi:hypothetical protein
MISKRWDEYRLHFHGTAYYPLTTTPWSIKTLCKLAILTPVRCLTTPYRIYWADKGTPLEQLLQARQDTRGKNEKG